MSQDVLPKLSGKDNYFNYDDNQSEHGYGSLEDVNSTDGCCSNRSSSSSSNFSPLPSPTLLIDEVLVDQVGDGVNISSSMVKEDAASHAGHESMNKDKENREVKKKGNGEENDQVFLNGNRFKFVPKSRQEDRNSGLRHNRGNRGARKHSRSESDAGSLPEGKPLILTTGRDDIVFVVKRVDRSLRRTYSESSSEVLPVRGILKYPRGWQRRTLSESNCDNNINFNMEGENDDGITRSMECISPQEESTEACPTSSSSSSSSPPPPVPLLEKTKNLLEEEKPKKSVHFNCFVSRATFNTNSIILDDRNNKKKKNRRKDSKSNQPNTAQQPNENNKPKQVHQSQQQQNQVTHPVKSNTKPRKGPMMVKNNNNNNKDDNKSVKDGDDEKDMTENVNPETKIRSRQDSGYDSETNERKKVIEPTGTTFIKSSKRKFTINKVDLTQ